MESDGCSDWNEQTYHEIRRMLWESSEWRKRFVWHQRTSDGEVNLFCKIYLRRLKDKRFNDVLEYITTEEYSVRKLAGTLETIPAECLENGFC